MKSNIEIFNRKYIHVRNQIAIAFRSSYGLPEYEKINQVNYYIQNLYGYIESLWDFHVLTFGEYKEFKKEVETLERYFLDKIEREKK